LVCRKNFVATKKNAFAYELVMAMGKKYLAENNWEKAA
jgi:hypothetical protein